MNICIDAKVISQDDVEIGKIKGIVFYPHLGEVTHLVVYRGVLLPYDTLVPMSMAQGNKNGRLILHVSAEKAVGEHRQIDQCGGRSNRKRG